MGAHLLEVMAGAERPSGSGENDAADTLVRGKIVERRLQRLGIGNHGSELQHRETLPTQAVPDL